MDTAARTSTTSRAEAPAAPPRRYVLVGAGGVGSWLVRMLTPFLHSLGQPATIAIVDGDDFEEGSNRSRMLFAEPGPKAVVLAEELAQIYGDRLNILPVPEYLTAQNAASLIGEGDVIFSMPDNHVTRRLVEQRCLELRDAALFSGGNDAVVEGESTGTVGNVQVFVRRAGHNVTNPISAFHPEIAEPRDHHPQEAGCLEASTSAPQLIVTNAGVAAALLGAFYAWHQGRLGYEEAYLDVLSGRVVPVARALRAP